MLSFPLLLTYLLTYRSSYVEGVEERAVLSFPLELVVESDGPPTSARPPLSLFFAINSRDIHDRMTQVRCRLSIPRDETLSETKPSRRRNPRCPACRLRVQSDRGLRSRPAATLYPVPCTLYPVPCTQSDRDLRPRPAANPNPNPKTCDRDLPRPQLGYAHFAAPAAAGTGKAEVHSWRLAETRTEALRRFFVGGE